MNDKDIVALSGAHALGKMHPERSGMEGPWVKDFLTFSNAYFVDLLEGQWENGVNSAGNSQFFDKSKGTAMAPSDMALLADPIFKSYVEKYAKDQDLFFKDFSESFIKLQELGCSGLTEVAGLY